MFVIQVAENGTGPINRPDDALLGDNGGVKFLFDLASGLSRPEIWLTTNPATGDLIKDVAEVSSEASLVLTAANAGLVDYSGNGLDFTGLADSRAFIQTPASVMAAMGQEQFVCVYFKMPTEVQWAGSTGNKLPFITSATGNANNTSVADPLSVNCFGSSIVAEWQVTTGSRASAGILPTADYFDKFVQLAAWRKDDQLHISLRSADAITTASSAAPDDCGTSFATNQLKFGITQSGWNPSFSTFGKSKIKLYRGWAENLTTSDRDIVDVLDGDWTRTVNRGVFS